MVFKKIFMVFQKISMVFQKISMVFHENLHGFSRNMPDAPFFFLQNEKKSCSVFCIIYFTFAVQQPAFNRSLPAPEPAVSTHYLALHGTPHRDAAQMAAHGHVIEQKQKEENDGGIEHGTVNLLDADLHHLRHKALHIFTEGKRGAAEAHTVDGGTVARKVVGHEIGKATGIDGTAEHSAHDGMKKVEHRQSLEEMLERHYLVKPHEEGAAQGGVGKATGRANCEMWMSVVMSE